MKTKFSLHEGNLFNKKLPSFIIFILFLLFFRGNNFSLQRKFFVYPSKEFLPLTKGFATFFPPRKISFCKRDFHRTILLSENIFIETFCVIVRIVLGDTYLYTAFMCSITYNTIVSVTYSVFFMYVGVFVYTLSITQIYITYISFIREMLASSHSDKSFCNSDAFGSPWATSSIVVWNQNQRKIQFFLLFSNLNFAKFIKKKKTFDKHFLFLFFF